MTRRRTITGNDGRTAPATCSIIITAWRPTTRSTGGWATTSSCGWDASTDVVVVYGAPVPITRTTEPRTTRTRTTRSRTETRTPITKTRRGPTMTSRPRAGRAPPCPEDDVEGRSRAASRVTLCPRIASRLMEPRSTTGASSRAAPAHRVNSFLSPLPPGPLFLYLQKKYIVPVLCSRQKPSRDHHLHYTDPLFV